MTRDEAKEYIKTHIPCETFLTRAKHGGYICPFCGGGDKHKGTGSLQVKKEANYWKCFACPDDSGGDVISLYQRINNIDFPQALNELADMAHIVIDADARRASERRGTEKDNKTYTDKGKAAQIGSQDVTGGPPIDFGAHSETQTDGGPFVITDTDHLGGCSMELKTDFTEYYKKAAADLETSEEGKAYLASRGISMDTARSFFIGFDGSWISSKAKASGKGVPSPRLIIPSAKYCYLARATDGREEYAKQNETGNDGHMTIFNHKAIARGGNIFVTEGAIDALSIIEGGYSAVGLNSTSNVDKLMEVIKGSPRAADLCFILSLDNDNGGAAATEKLKTLLRSENLPFICSNVSGAEKDPNDALVKDRARFVSDLAKADELANLYKQDPDGAAYYIKSQMAADIQEFTKSEIKTGFRNIDTALGGVYSGLYVIGAVSGLGKTTFCTHLADKFAENGRHVIFYSLEQSRLEIIAKGVSRYLMTDKKKKVPDIALRTGKAAADLQEGINIYLEKTGGRITVIEGDFNVTTDSIEKYVKDFIKRTGEKPIVMIDYLQALLHADSLDDRDLRAATDKIVIALRLMAKNLGITVFLVSSLNRANYLSTISLESFKESGGIEYTADAVWGVQYYAIHEDVFSKDNKTQEKRDRLEAASKSEPRDIELKVLKNRFGTRSDLRFDFYAASCLFTEKEFMPDTRGEGEQIFKRGTRPRKE